MKKKIIAEYKFTPLQLIQDSLILIAIFVIFAIGAVKIDRKQNEKYIWDEQRVNEYLTKLN